MYTVKYRPNKIEDFIGNKNIIQPFIRWLLQWNTDDKKSKCLLISGLTGVGKSLLVELILKKHDYNIINLALDDDRDKEYMNNVIKPLIKTKKTFDGQENVLVVSDIDSGSDYGFIATLTECIRDTKIPIICICDNRYDQSIKPILNYCFDIKMKIPRYQFMGLVKIPNFYRKILLKNFSNIFLRKKLQTTTFINYLINIKHPLIFLSINE